MKLVAVLWLSAVLMAGSSAAMAQQMYRCGSIYQDRPCEAGAPDKVMRSSGGEAAQSNTPRPVADPYCIKRGTDAQQIMWARESGKTAEELSRQAQNDPQRQQLIAEVYAQRGTAPQVRDAIQAQCLRDRDLMGGIRYMPEAPRAQVNSEPVRDNTPAKTTTSSSYNHCDNFKAQQESLRSQERHGGSAQVMESLKQRRDSLEKSARAQGC
ncbi:MAG: hypothetical protein V4627_12300 [Pseudomonadota bacterium]